MFLKDSPCIGNCRLYSCRIAKYGYHNEILRAAAPDIFDEDTGRFFCNIGCYDHIDESSLYESHGIKIAHIVRSRRALTPHKDIYRSR